MYEPMTSNTTFEPSIMARYESFRYGWDLYTARQPVTDCHNAEARRGWWSALESEAAASLPANSANRLGF